MSVLPGAGPPLRAPRRPPGGMHVAVLANLKANAPLLPGLPPDAWSELESDATVNAIVRALGQAGHRATFLEGGASLTSTLPLLNPDICFNLCEGHFGESRESHVPALLEMLRIPYTGSGVLPLALTLDKPTTKRILAFHGLPSPAFQVFESADEPLSDDLSFPLFVKPAREGTSIGITAGSLVHDEVELRHRVTACLERYRQPALVERYIRGREVTVGLVGNVEPGQIRQLLREPHVPHGLYALPPLEVDFSGYPASEGGVYTHRIKTESWDSYHFFCPAQLSSARLTHLQGLAAAAFAATGCVDVARVDFRLDADDGDAPYILEINALPGLGPGFSDMVLAATADGVSYDRLINGILDAALSRYGLVEGTGVPVARSRADMNLRKRGRT